MGEVKWIRRRGPGRLGVLAKPRGPEWLEENIRTIRNDGCDILVSLLQPEETFKLGLGEEARLCRQYGIEFISFPIENFAVPPFDPDTLIVIRALSEQLRRGSGVVLHCQTGVGRTGTMAAAVLVSEGWRPRDALRAVSKARGRSVPDNGLQRRFVELLGTLDFTCPPGCEGRKGLLL